MSSAPGPSVEEKNKQMGKLFVFVIVAMFLFGFVSIPLYRIICDAIDPGGSAYSNGSVDAYEGVKTDTSRTITVSMATNVNRQLNWDFNPPAEHRMEVHPGERKHVVFKAKNNDLGSMRGKAVYDIVPPEAGAYFKKIECFCFQEQELAAGESADMPLIFWFDPSMPPEIKNITIAYTFFNMDSSLTRSIKKRTQAKP